MPLHTRKLTPNSRACRDQAEPAWGSSQLPFHPVPSPHFRPECGAAGDALPGKKANGKSEAPGKCGAHSLGDCAWKPLSPSAAPSPHRCVWTCPGARFYAGHGRVSCVLKAVRGRSVQRGGNMGQRVLSAWGVCHIGLFNEECQDGPQGFVAAIASPNPRPQEEPPNILTAGSEKVNWLPGLGAVRAGCVLDGPL